ncbi:MAG: hypothetical protein AAB875_06365, partial [Patescibacteria group bacterium]
LGPEHDAVGLAGEEAFASRYGYRVDHEYAQRGDGGADFATYLGSVDVKTYRKPAHLLVEQGTARADIYVLVRYVAAEPPTIEVHATAILGWAYLAEVRAAPISDVGGYGVQSHALTLASLRGLPSLDTMFGAWCFACGQRVIYPRDTRPMTGPRPADYAAVCDACWAKGWQLVQPESPKATRRR